MTTTATTTAAGPILANDLGKYKCVACAYDPRRRRLPHDDTSRAEPERLLRRARPAVVVIEACTLAGWVTDLCTEIGVPCKVANTAAAARSAGSSRGLSAGRDRRSGVNRRGQSAAGNR